MRRYGIIMIVACVLSLGWAFTAGAEEVKITSISGQGVMDLVKANKGKILFINFFASWCPPCREEIPELVQLRKDFPETKVTFASISLDTEPKKLETFVRKMGFNYPVYMAEDDVAPGFNITSIPHNMVFSQDGKLIANEPGMVSGADLRVFFNELLKMKKD